MTQIQIRIEEVEIDGKPKLQCHIDNMRADTSTEKEKAFCDLMEKSITNAVMDSLKNVQVLSQSSWPDATTEVQS